MTDYTFLDMGTMPKHRALTGSIYSQLSRYFDLFSTEEIISKEDCDLVYLGNRIEGGFLADLETSAENYSSDVLNMMSVVIPDLMIFKKNPFLYNNTGVRVIGCPDLIVEVWSESNKLGEIQFKQQLYSTSNKTEFWQIYQDSDTITVTIGNQKLPTKSLKSKLTTQNGLEIDLQNVYK
ncbi:MAG: Uma2 family endonuclease [Defluviitaleaceae bacterium]|nr:Uma2 family endonuclease [Defluviitaleaceae bacterium]